MRQQEVHRSVCPLDCPDTCAVEITIEDGKMVHLGGQKTHPMTRGFACVKMSKAPERQHHPDRLTEPLRRIGSKGEGRFEPVDWDTALDEIAEQVQKNINEFGEQSLLPFSYAGTMGLVQRDHPSAFFRALGASELDWTVCAATAGTAWEMNYGPNKLSTAPEDVEYSKLIILWGINIVRSNSHLVPWIKKAKKRGARVIHIDPFANETSRLADEHWAIKVGTDAALALAIAHELIKNNWIDKDFLERYAVGYEEYANEVQPWDAELASVKSGIPASQIRQIASQFGAEPASFIKVGYGMSRNEGGGNAIRAITLLPALTGAWKTRGGGGALSTSGAFPFNTDLLTGKHLLRPNRRHVNQNQLGMALESNDPTEFISTLFVYNSNPAAIAPDTNSVIRGLSRDDLFTVVLEHFQTDTADYADYLLPATTFVEHSDIYTAYGHYYLQWAEPIMPAAGLCKPNSWVFSQLAKRLGISDPIFSMSTEEVAASLFDAKHPYLDGITFERLRDERSIRLNLPENFRPYSEGSTFKDRKIRFTPAPTQIEFEEQVSEEYPLRLISPPGPFILNTSMGNLQSLITAAGGEPTVLIHPDDAARFNIESGTHIDISSRQGSICRKVNVTTDARVGTLIALGQWWPKLAPDRKSLNHLTSQGLTDIGGGSLFGNPVVRIQTAETSNK